MDPQRKNRGDGGDSREGTYLLRGSRCGLGVAQCAADNCVNHACFSREI